MKKNMTTNIIGWGVSVVLFVAGSWFTSSRVVDTKIETAKAEAYQANIQAVQRISSLEEAVNTIKEDNKTIKSDIKEILKILR